MLCPLLVRSLNPGLDIPQWPQSMRSPLEEENAPVYAYSSQCLRDSDLVNVAGGAVALRHGVYLLTVEQVLSEVEAIKLQYAVRVFQDSSCKHVEVSF